MRYKDYDLDSYDEDIDNLLKRNNIIDDQEIFEDNDTLKSSKILQDAENTFKNFIYNDNKLNKEYVYYADDIIMVQIIHVNEDGYLWDLYKRKKEWKAIDNLIEIYQKQFDQNHTSQDKEDADKAAQMLLDQFYPLFKKYSIVLSTGQINFNNTEQKLFIKLFMDNPLLKTVLCHKKIPKALKEQITGKFNFIVEAYGAQGVNEIVNDLHMLFFVLAKRYKDVGKSFCCYVYNSFKYEVARHIKKYQKNPANFHYKTTELNEDTLKAIDTGYTTIEDMQYENELGMPDMSWVHGVTCSDVFKIFTPTERTIFIKYYLEDWNDSQIADLLGVHINTANQRRKSMIKRLARKMGIDMKELKRHRKSGKKAIGL